MIPVPTIPMKAKINGSFKTFFRIIISGKDNPMTAIIKASDVPSEASFSIKTETMGTILAALEYNGMPMSTDKGTLNQEDLFMREAI
jgi:hypothetical protein